MNAEDSIRKILVQAAKQLEKDWHVAYNDEAGADWHGRAKSQVDLAVAEARRLMKEHAEELGNMARLFEKTRIQKLYEELDNAQHRVNFQQQLRRAPYQEPTPEELAADRVDGLRNDIFARHEEIDEKDRRRFEREAIARVTFRDWVLEKIHELFQR